MAGLVVKAKEEFRKLLVIAVFFSIGFCLIHLSNRLLTEGMNVELASITKALIGGLIVAKVLLIVDLLPFVDAFPDRPLAYNVAWKSSLYVVAAVIFLYLEPFAKGLFRGAGFFSSNSRAWHELMLPRTWATLIWVTMLLVVFVTLQELSEAIGTDELRRIFFRPRDKATAGTHLQDQRFRGAA